ncbi:MAG: cadmium resistance transporter, partial [Planctomycetota bacterium]
MFDAVETLAVSAAVFASTNVDDLFLLAAFFADPRLRPRAIVAGQFLGIGALTAASAVAALAALTVPDGYVALLGVVPLALGVKKLVELRRGDRHENDDLAQRAATSSASQILAVAGVTIANGGDNLGVYIPLFAREPAQIPF